MRIIVYRILNPTSKEFTPRRVTTAPTLCSLRLHAETSGRLWCNVGQARARRRGILNLKSKA